MSIESSTSLSRWKNRPAEVLLLCGSMMILAMTLPPFFSCPVILAVNLLLATKLAEIPLSAYVNPHAVPFSFLTVGGLMLAVGFSPDDGISVSRESVAYALKTICRSLSTLSCLMLLATTVPVSRILQVFRRLGLPEALLDLFLSVYRVVFLLSDSARTLYQAQRLRGGMQSYRDKVACLSMTAQALARESLLRSRHMNDGLLARGVKRQSIYLRPLQKFSAGAVIAIIALCCFCVGLTLFLQYLYFHV